MSRQEDGKKEGAEEGNKDLQLNVVDTFKKKQKTHSLQKINEDTEQLDVRYTVYISVYQKKQEPKEKSESLKTLNLETQTWLLQTNLERMLIRWREKHWLKHSSGSFNDTTIVLVEEGRVNFCTGPTKLL